MGIEKEKPLQELSKQEEQAIENAARFDAVSSREAHSITFTALSLFSGPFSRKEAKELFVDLQGDDPIWIPAANTQFNYSVDKFEPAGLTRVFQEVRALKNRKEPVDVLVTELVDDEVAVDHAKAYAGVLMDWSLSSEFSVNQFFGESRKTRSHLGGAALKKSILQILIEEPGISEVELNERLGLKREFARSQSNNFLEEFVNRGVVIKEDASDWHERMFEFTGSKYKHVSIMSEDLIPETKAIYDTLEVFEPEDVISADQLFELILYGNPKVDAIKLRHVLAMALVDDFEYEQGGTIKYTKLIPSLKSLGGTFNGGRKTKFTVDGSHKPEISGLLDRLIEVDGRHSSAINYFTYKADRIIGNPEKVKKLVGKSLNSSIQAKPVSLYEVENRLKVLLQEQGTLQVKQATAVIKQSGVEYSLKSLEKLVREIAQKDDFVLERRAKGNGTRRQVDFIALS